MKDEEIRKLARMIAKDHYQKMLNDTQALILFFQATHHPNLEETVRTVLKEIERLKE